MATTEHNGAMTFKDANGNLYILYPVTQAGNVLMSNGDILEEVVDQKANEWVAATSGTNTAYTVTLDPAPTELYIGMTITIIPHIQSYTNVPTLNVNGLGAKQIRMYNDRTKTTDLLPGTDYLRVSRPYIVTYDGTYWIVNINNVYNHAISGNMYGLGSSSLYGHVKLANNLTTDDTVTGTALDARQGKVLKELNDKKANLWVAETTGTNAFQFKVALDPVPTELYVGMQVVIIPHATSTSVNATLNVNDKGAKRFKFRGETSGTLYDPVNNDFLTEGKPVLVMYDGSYWVINDSNVDSGKVTFKNYTNWNRKLSDSFCGGTAGGSYIRNASTLDSMSIFACSNGEAFSDVYFENLTHSFCSGVEVKRDYPATASYYGQYCMFAGGRYNNSSARDAVDVYDINLVKKTSTSLSEARYLAGSTSENIGSYVLIAGGSKNNDGSSNVVDAFNSSLVRSTPTTLSGAGRAEGSIVNKHAVFAVKTSSEIIVNAYSSSLTRTILSSLSENKSGIMGEHVSGYAIFAGGEKRNGSTSSSASSVDIYDGTLTKITTTVSFTPGSGMFEACGFSTQDNAFFLGEDLITTDYGYVFMFDKNLTLTTTGKTRVEGSLRDRPSTRLNFNTGVFLTSTSKAYALNTNTVINIPAYSAYKFNNDTKEKNTYNNMQVSYGSTPVNGYIRPLKTVSDI